MTQGEKVMSDVKIRELKESDAAEIVKLWNECLPQDATDEATFKKRVLEDPNLDAAGAPVVEAGGEIVGFALAIVRKVPNDGLGLEEDRGWITMLFVRQGQRKKGLGEMLVRHCLDFIRSRKRQVVYICGLTGSSPNYFFPGVERDRYPDAVRLMIKQGFVVTHDAYHMERPLKGMDTPTDVQETIKGLEREGITIELLAAGKEKELLDFLWQEFPGDWHRHTEIVLNQGANQERFFTARKQGEVVGYCHYEEDGHFGPFFVRPDMRYKKIGTAIFFKCVERLKEIGCKTIWFGWADDPVPRRFYLRHGMKDVRRYAMMRKEIK